MPKVTFSLDEETVRALRQVARRTQKPQSLVVREAITAYAASEEKLSEPERDRLLGILRDIARRVPSRSAADVDRELSDIRRARRSGWNRSRR
ncbi:MAG: ribbon-helix-helix protein, CopG family [Acidobacteriota bacterium]